MLKWNKWSSAKDNIYQEKYNSWYNEAEINLLTYFLYFKTMHRDAKNSAQSPHTNLSLLHQTWIN